MTVEQRNVIDIISRDKESGQVILTVSDHLEWSDSTRHQEILQAKLNAYLAFVESGGILTKFPDAAERTILVKVVLKFKPDPEGRAFLQRAQEAIEKAGFAFMYNVFAESNDN
jgi:uncharacterized protein DUF6572